MTRDELAQLLLCYIGTAADIIEFFDSFKVNPIYDQDETLVWDVRSKAVFNHRTTK